MPAPPITLPPASIEVTQRFSRRGCGFLWNKRNELDPGQVSIINALYNNRKKSSIECEQHITYRLSKKKAGLLGYGRYYGTKGSLETLEKECRGTICSEFYHDIDVVNCHPVLLTQYAHRYYNRDLPELDYYVQHRDKVLATISPNRDQAKEELIRILYGGTNKFDATAKLSAEIRAFSKFLSQQPEHKKLFDAVKNEDNVYGTFLSFILQTEERHCMLAIKQSLEESGWSVDVLAYDGVMVRKREGSDLQTSIQAAEKAVVEKVGYQIRLVVKEFSSFDVPSVSEEIMPGVSLDAYTDAKAEFEKNHFYHIPSDQVVEVTPTGELLYMKAEHALRALNNHFFIKLSQKFGDYQPLFLYWMRSDLTRREIRLIDFKESNDPSVFTMPLVFEYTKAPLTESETAVSLFQELLGIFASGAQLDYLLNWLAHLLQKPLENPKVAMVITGLKGCGKDTAFDFLRRFVIGPLYSINYGDNAQFFGPHDTGRMNKFLVKLEEADTELCRKHASTLKASITADTITYNPKGVKEIQAANYCRYVFTTNKGNPFEMNDGERRFMVFNAGISKKGDTAFWERVHKELFTVEAGRAVAEWLMARDISSWNKFVLPISEYQAAVVESEKSTEQLFVENWDGQEISATEFWEKYLDYCNSNSLPSCKSSLALGKRLLNLLRDGLLIKKRRMDAVFYSKSA